MKEDLNLDSLICADDFSSLEALTDYVLHADDTPELYSRHLLAPPFVENRPSSVYDLNHLVDFFRSPNGA